MGKTMNTQFVPHQPEKMITAEITEKELFVLEELRKHDFGKITIHKANGVLVRIEPILSILIKPGKNYD